MNALIELKKTFEYNHICFEDIDCANIYARTWDDNGKTKRKLVYDSENDSIEVLTNFLNEIEYDNDYGCQELFGMILTNKNSWLERGEYDGSEWWEYRTIPLKEQVLNFMIDNAD